MAFLDTVTYILFSHALITVVSLAAFGSAIWHTTVIDDVYDKEKTITQNGLISEDL